MEKKKKIEEVKESMQNLMKNKDFQLVFLDYYLNDDCSELVLNNDLNNQATIDELKAKQAFKNFINRILVWYNKPRLKKEFKWI